MAGSTGHGDIPCEIRCENCGLAVTATRGKGTIIYTFDIVEWNGRCLHLATGSPALCMSMHARDTAFHSLDRVGTQINRGPAMPRYFFHVRNDTHRLDDDKEGQTLGSDEAAKATARQIARQLSDEPEIYGGYNVVVMDEDGKIVTSVPIVSE
jgi:hypothetical protein